MTILIVEDASLMRLRLREILTNDLNVEPENIHEVANGHEALQKYRTINPDYVFLDIYMPGISGVETVAELKKIDSDAYVIMMTASSDRRTVVNCIRNGAKDYIKKPPTLEKVARSLSIDLYNPKPMKRADRKVEIVSVNSVKDEPNPEEDPFTVKDKAPTRDIIDEIFSDIEFDIDLDDEDKDKEPE